MKRFFKFALVALATAAVAVACQKPEQQPEKIALKGISLNKEAVELAIGAKETLTVKFDPENVTEKPTIEWSTSAPAVATVAEGEVTAVAAGEATITAKAGSFTATCKVTVKGEEQPEPGDFTSPDWANIGAITNGNHTFKFTKDDKNAYFFSERTSEGRYNDIWGGNGYIYFALDFDNDLTTGVELNGNGKYEYIGFIYCFGEKPKVEIVKAGDCLPEEYTVENIIARGSADDNSVKVEYCVPLADLPQLPENFTIYTWGNKDMAKVIYKYPYEAPKYEHDYTPSAEYLAETNLWKAVDAAGSDFFIINCINGEWPRSAEASVDGVYALTHEQSTYKMHYDVASNGDWERQLFLFPKAENAIPVVSGEKYNFKMTVYADKDLPRVFFKLVSNQADKDNHEGGDLLLGDAIKTVKAGEPTVFEYSDVTAGFNADNITFVIDFGGAPADVDIYVKDIIIEHVGAPVPDTWDYTPSAEYLASSNLWKAVDADEPTITFLYHPNWADPTEEPTAELKESTYTIKLKDADAGNAYSGQMIITPKNDFIIDPAKTYNFSCKIHSTTGTSVWIKMHQPGVNWPEVFETNGAEAPADRIAIAAGETKEIKVEGIKSMYESALPQELLFDFAPHGADNIIHIKDIIVEEVGGETPVELGPFDSNVEWAASTDDKAYTDNVLNVTYDGATYEDVANVKLGTSSKVGKFTLTIPAGTTYVTYWAIGWNGKDGVYKITAGDNVIDGKAAANTGAANTSPYNVTITDADQYMINLGGALPADLPVTIETTSEGYRAFFFGIQAHTDAAPNPPASVNIKLDGDLSDWDAVDGVEAGSFKEFKFASDADNIYMYFKIKRAKIIAAKTEPFVFNWRRYIAFGIDADNNAETGTTVAFAGMNIPGCEIGGNFYPFRGTASAASGTDGVEIVNGVEEQGGVTTEIGSNVPDGADKKVSAFGKVDDEFVYVEAGFARAAVGSPAAGTIKIQLSLAWDLTDILEYSLK